LTAKSLRYNGNPKECIDLLSMLPESRFKEHNYSLYHYNLALAYEELGNTELQLKHLILSANEDLHMSKKDYSSLYSLAMLLFQSGDVQRASSYLGKALKDALQYNYPVGLVRNASASLVVNEILHDSEISRRKRLVVGIAVISSLGLLAIILALYLRILLRKLHRSNRRLQVTTAKLASTSLIKDSFLAGYMEQAAYYIRKVDENKSQLRRTLKSDGLEGVTALLRSPSYADEEYPNFYKHFDETFLGIFPDFIESVNKYLAAGHFKINKGTHTLNTELRILALIRLGISDPERIAKILNTSKGTVFTYRSKLRHNASCPPEEFENKICEIN
jgi:tetratricopeptide (TPR) repeat protein